MAVVQDTSVPRDGSLYNEDLAPIPPDKRKWGAFEIFNVWNNDIQSLFGYSLAASLFITYGLNGWAVFAAIVLAGAFVMVLVNLTGRPSVKYGIPYPVMARASMGVQGAKFPALIRGIVAIFWYGVQTYFASTAVALLLNSLFELEGGAEFLGMTAVGWLSYLLVCVFQVALFMKGIEWVGHFLNWAGPFVYAVMIALMLVIWVKDNIPGKLDLEWLKAGGGILKKGQHPPAPRFNAGQKGIFWIVIIGGVAMSLSGWHLLVPFEDGNTVADQQFWVNVHAVVAMVFIAVMLAHAYIGSVGMEGAYDAMGSGEVDENWAREHHSLWLAQEKKRAGLVPPQTVPAE